MDTAVGRLGTALTILGDTGTNGGKQLSLTRLEVLARTLHTGLGFVRDFAPVGDAVLGEGTRRFLVLGQSADEVRATGGFVSSIWMVTVKNSNLDDVRYHDAVRVDDWDRLVLYPPAPRGLAEHMNAHVWLMRDVSWEPDFPTTARIARDMFNLGQRQEVDGVAAVTQWALLEIVTALGEIPDPAGGPPITSRNLMTKLERGTDEFGRAYMDVTLQGVLESLRQPMPLSTLLRLASALHRSLEERELLVYLEDTPLQAVVGEHGWGGRVKDGQTDYLYVVDSNVGWSKADRNIERRVYYQVDLTRDTGPRVKLTLGYNNFSGPGSVGCEPQWLNRGTNYGELKNACYWNYVRVYMPQAAQLLSHTRLELPEYSVAAEIGRASPGDDTVRTFSRYNKKVLSGLFALGAGEQNDVHLVYDLPRQTKSDEGAIHHDLLIQKQPGVRRREVTVEFLVPEQYRLDSSSLEPASSEAGKFTFVFSATKDVNLIVDFTERAIGSE